MSFKPFRTCREVTALVIAREDRALSLRERAIIRAHFLICQACPIFERQVLGMREALGAWRNYRDGAEPGESA
ncbi:MAG: zf-HC2 domain-containing protein [Betaproteobacteria bacterium]|nr:zf-HC2 domain-containing protein [Betaproteobacteria bacterium]MBU6512676.1 zf-HC2 domain-containing protein [Betaproteobacteria bacterium]MDE1956884.1 zf-HC2 domain-containing protein [Betaproteobacteria bacterium]MDE2153485.1 zf-HC2 domain-containing protein [Betaproteobacteria bacterium]MDE2477433.1 zf-HC2 domain-containing protein [Betaproteobacteria bacterium]